MSTRGWKHAIRPGRLLYPLSHLAGPIFQFLKKTFRPLPFRLSISPGVVLWSSAFMLLSIRNPQGLKDFQNMMLFSLGWHLYLIFAPTTSDKLLLTPGSWSILLAKPVPLPHTNSAGIMADGEKRASESDVFLSVWHSPALFVCSQYVS